MNSSSGFDTERLFGLTVVGKQPKLTRGGRKGISWQGGTEFYGRKERNFTGY